MFRNLRKLLQSILDSPNADTRRPLVDTNFESNVPGLFVIGDLAGAPVVKLAMAQGSRVAEYIANKPNARTPNRYDLLVQKQAGIPGYPVDLDISYPGGGLVSRRVNLSQDIDVAARW